MMATGQIDASSLQDLRQMGGRMSRIGGGLPVVRSVTKSTMKGRQRTSNTFSVRSNGSHVWASERGETRMKVLFDVSSFFTTFLIRAIGGKAYVRGKSHL
jgi:hypothetical protein